MHTTEWHRARVIIAVFGIMAHSAACGRDTTSIDTDVDGFRIVQPPLYSVAIDDASLRVWPGPLRVTTGDTAPTGEPLPGILLVRGIPDLATPRIPDDVAVIVEISTSDGDIERIYLRRQPCRSGGHDVQCNQIEIEIEPSYTAHELLGRLAGVPAGLVRFHTEVPVAYGPNQLAGAWVFDPDIDGAMAVARQWPGVRDVRRVGVGQIGTAPPEWLAGALPIQFAPPVQNDGRVQLQSGTTITVEYSQPDGSSLTASVSG